MCKNKEITKLEKKIKTLEKKINPYTISSNNFMLEMLKKDLIKLKQN